jgi:hypothetical protein
MTFLLYSLWLLSLFWVAGEIDRLLVKRFARQMESELPSSDIWFLPPIVAFALPGAGQFLNRELVKALLIISWPFLLLLTGVPRPWQMLRFNTYNMLLPWYLLSVIDALAVALVIHYQRKRQVDQESQEANKQNSDQDLTRFLERRARRQDTH